MMIELKSRLTELGLNEEMTDKVIATVADYAKSKIPTQFHSLLDDVIVGKSPDLGSVMNLLGGLKGFFGGNVLSQ